MILYSRRDSQFFFIIFLSFFHLVVRVGTFSTALSQSILFSVIFYVFHVEKKVGPVTGIHRANLKLKDVPLRILWKIV